MTGKSKIPPRYEILTDSWGFPAAAVPAIAVRTKRENFIVIEYLCFGFAAAEEADWEL